MIETLRMNQPVVLTQIGRVVGFDRAFTNGSQTGYRWKLCILFDGQAPREGFPTEGLARGDIVETKYMQGLKPRHRAMDQTIQGTEVKMR